MTLATTESAHPLDHDSATESRPAAAARPHPLALLEHHARAELRSLITDAPAPASHEATLLAVLGWDLGLAGDELA